MVDKRVLREIIDTALSRGGDFAEVFVEQRQTTGISCEANKVERIISGLDVGAGIRVIAGDNTAYAYTNDLSSQGLREAAEMVARAAQSSTRGAVMDFTKLKPLCDFEIEERPDEAPVEAKVELVQRANSAAREVDGRIRQVTVTYGDTTQKVIIANSEGAFVEDERIRVRLGVNAVAAQGEVIQTGQEVEGGFSGVELIKHPEDLGRRAAARAVLMLGARSAPVGKMRVIMAGEAGGTMVHEACGHGLEADLVQKQLSVYAAREGEKVASELITVVDDATLPQRYGSFRFDDEGEPAQRTVLIEKGILKQYMYDKLTARRRGCSSTGNGRRESYQHKPIPRMTNTLILPGRMDPEEIIREAKSGLYVRKMGGGQVNTTTGDFVFEVAEGYLIEDGEISVPVRGATLTGNGPRVLANVDMVGHDLGYAIGTCGKDGQGVPVADAQPTISVPELIVGGILD